MATKAYPKADEIQIKDNQIFSQVRKKWLPLTSEERVRQNYLRILMDEYGANVGSLGIVQEVPEAAITSPEYQVWRLKTGFLPDFMALMIRTDFFLSLVDFNRVGGVKQRMYYDNLAEIYNDIIRLL